MNQKNLFQNISSNINDPSDINNSSLNTKNNAPIAYKMRPNHFQEYLGHEKVFKRFKFLKNNSIPLPSLIIWGPPGVGKTSLAHIVAKTHHKELYLFNAVLGGIADLKKLIVKAIEIKQLLGKEPLLFIDEIHRFNKAQQDALLPYVEDGSFTLIGATTQPPQVSINRALISRMQIIHLEQLSYIDISNILKQICKKLSAVVNLSIIEMISKSVNGDARIACNYLEICINEKTKNIDELQKLINLNNNLYDKNGDRHYDVISAFIKSLRGSDPSSAIFWMAVMIDGGEDPLFIARRLIIFASEDIGNADPEALTIAVAAFNALKLIGMPEARINLAQACTYLASTFKSNSSYQAINKALEYVKNNPTIEVPTHLRNNHSDISNYKYPHSYPNNFTKQAYGSPDIFYIPSEQGVEKKLKDRLQGLWE